MLMTTEDIWILLHDLDTIFYKGEKFTTSICCPGKITLSGRQGGWGWVLT